MLELLSFVEHAALGELIKRVITGGIDWAKKRKKPADERIDAKLEQLVSKNLPTSIPPENREAAVSSVLELVRPTFEQIAQYDPQTHYLLDKLRTESARKSSSGWGVKRAVKKAPYRIHAVKKSTVKTHAITKAAAAKIATKKAVAKKAPAKKSSLKKAAPRRGR